ncbi:hypothetical protein [Pengzhenrongella frigida]|uniref:Uncharacterized protein n=1 Tax=Pengzhenrongella frigida TaxID=1259133 RepID=A0A4Q5N6U0_9MICO|nr:hypothetical protein [Cellulomonas sp. HLT2-17]RYV52051.1 hypothetical protein EUA98_05655 [Cellulomonas sp. HLT2-17]
MTSIAATTATSTFATRYLDALPAGTQVEHFDHRENRLHWTKSDGDTWVSAVDGSPVATEDVYADADRLFVWPAGRGIPTFAAPLDECPSWADRSDAWSWIAVDDVWQHFASHSFGTGEARGVVTVDRFDHAHADGTIDLGEVGISVDVEDIEGAADARQIGQWLVEAGDLVDRINGVTAA